MDIQALIDSAIGNSNLRSIVLKTQQSCLIVYQAYCLIAIKLLNLSIVESKQIDFYRFAANFPNRKSFWIWYPGTMGSSKMPGNIIAILRNNVF